MSDQNLLSQISSLVTLDVDSMDPAVAQKHLSAKFCGMTSNQAIVHNEAIRPENRSLVQRALQYAHEQESIGSSRGIQDAIDMLTVLLAKNVYPFITGNVHVQTSPSKAYDTNATIDHAQRLVSLFEANDIPRNRVCVKIPLTPESVLACAQLSQLNIQTLGTCLFSVPQAVAASQASCICVSPYLNELRVHFQPSLWRELQNPAREHPMAATIQSILHVFRVIKTKTLVMPASIVTAREAIGLVSLRPHRLTLSGSILDQLAALPAVSLEQLASPPFHASKGGNDIHQRDFLENEAALLRAALDADTESSRKLSDALQLFEECEKNIRDFLLSCKCT